MQSIEGERRRIGGFLGSFAKSVLAAAKDVGNAYEGKPISYASVRLKNLFGANAASCADAQ